MTVPDLFATPETRVEGEHKVRGTARYAADARPPAPGAALWARVLLSPHPHARVLRVDTVAARALPGVHAVLTGADVRPARFGRLLQDWPVLAWDRVRFVGDRVAAVAAETEAIAEQALRLISVEYEELPPVFTPEEALAPGAPILHPDAAEHRFLSPRARAPLPHPNLQGFVEVRKGEEDIERIFASAPHVFEHTFTTPRQYHGYLEPRATLVWIEADGTARVVTTNKGPLDLRGQMAGSLGIPAERIVVEAPFIGGDFGGKGLSLDEFVCYFLARATGRPIRAVMDYADDLTATNPRHATTLHLKTAVDAEGRFLAHQAHVVYTGGAYAAGKPTPLLAPSRPWARTTCPTRT